MQQRHRTVTSNTPGDADAHFKVHHQEKGKSGWLGFGRKLLWTWWLWIAGAVACETAGHGNLAVVFASVGFVFYLVAPSERVPSYGLESRFSVNSHEFLTSMVGATGVPFIQGNKITVLKNGDEFYPAMLEAIANAKSTITMEAYIYWDGDISRQFAQAIAERRRAG